MNFNDVRGVVFKLQNPPRTYQNPPRTRQNPPKPTQNPNRKRHYAIQRPPRRAHSVLKHKMFSYSNFPTPETHGSMSYVFFIDQIPKSLTFEPAQRPNDDETKKNSREICPATPSKGRTLFSSTHPKHFSCSHPHSYTCTPLAEHFPSGCMPYLPRRTSPERSRVISRSVGRQAEPLLH